MVKMLGIMSQREREREESWFYHIFGRNSWHKLQRERARERERAHRGDIFRSFGVMLFSVYLERETMREVTMGCRVVLFFPLHQFVQRTWKLCISYILYMHI